MVEVKDEKPVTPLLEAMKVGDKEQWPIERFESVRVLAGRMNLKHARDGVQYSVRTDKKNLVVEVTREK